MSVTFVIGRSGSGKTSRCFRSIADALRADPLGPPLYWILPRQATFEAERRLTCDAGLAGFCRARVLGFNTLGKDILGETGGSQLPEVTAIGRQMILGHLLRRHAPQLLFFKTLERQAGLAAELDATFDELERAGKTADDLALLLNDLSHTGTGDVEAQTLLAKLHDVRLLYDSYNAFLGQDRLDPHRRLQQMLEAVKTSSSLAGSKIYVDGFLEFTNHERLMLGALAKAGATLEITLLMDPASLLVKNWNLNPDEMSLFHRTETTYRRLCVMFAEDHITINEPVLLKDNQRHKSPALIRVEREMFCDVGLGAPAWPASRKSATAKSEIRATPLFDNPSQPDENAIVRIEAPDRAAEVDAVARHILNLLKRGHRLRDIAVLMRSLENYQPLIDSSFKEHGIPYFVDHRRPAAHHPLICFLRSAMQAARFDWNHDAMMALMKTGLAGLTPAETDDLENYALQHRVRGSIWASAEPWAWRRDLLRAERETAGDNPQDDPLRIDRLRRQVSDHLAPLVALFQSGKPLKVRDVAAEIFSLFERFGIRQAMQRWIDDSGERGARADEEMGRIIEERDVHQGVWASLCALFEEMVDLLGEEQLTPADFCDVVESGLDRFDLGITPPTVDEVLVGPADRTRCPPVRSVFVLGLNEGEFPARPRDATVLSDRERRVMTDHKLELDAEGNRRLLDERLLGYVTLMQPSEHLILSRPMGDGAGRSAAPSVFWHRVAELFPEVRTLRVGREGAGNIAQIATPRQFVTGLMRWARSAGAETEQADSGWRSLYQWLVTEGSKHAAIDHLRTTAWPALSYSNNAHLSEKAAGGLFIAPLSADVGQLETMAACPFKHFVKYGLRLSSRESAGVGAGDLGQAYHRLLDRLVAAAIQKDGKDPSNPLNISAGEIHDAAVHVAKALRGELMLSSARNRYLLQRIEKTLADVIASQQAMMKRGSYRPAHAGVSFGRENSAIPSLSVRTKVGAEIRLHGKIDRIDMPAGSQDALIIDYGLGSNTLSLPAVYHGLSLKLLASLLALQAGGAELDGKSINTTAAFHLRLLRGYEDVKHPADALDPTDERFLLGVKPRGLFDLRALGDLDAGLEKGPSLVVQVYLKPDRTVGYLASTDSASTEDFQAVLALARKQIARIGDQILSGDIAVAPYRLARKSPCAACEFRGVCRFETPMNRYNLLVSLGRQQVLENLRQEAGHDG